LERARELRKSETQQRRKILVWNFEKQKLKILNSLAKTDWYFIVDFFVRLKLAIEIDGKFHKFQKLETQKGQYLKIIWIKIIRYKNNEVLMIQKSFGRFDRKLNNYNS